MADYTLYTNPMSRGRIARWALHEVDARYDQVIVEYGPRESKPAAFLKANPMAKVPTLVHHYAGHDHVVTECAAICHYLAEMHPEAGLLPEAHEKADYFRYLFFVAGPLEQASISQRMGWSSDDPQARRMLGFGSFELAVDALEAMLAGRDYVCGERFTAADIYVGAQVVWGVDFDTLPRRDTFVAYAERVKQRVAYRIADAIDEELIAERGPQG